MAYPFWLRLRWTLSGMLTYLFAVAVVVQLFPHATSIVVMATLPMSSSMAHLLTVFTLGPADLGVRGSGFPKDMFVLPLSTRSLVGWPMLYGSAINALLWMLTSTLVLIPAGMPPAILWPAAILSASTSWVQAIGWSPFPSPFARVPALAVALTPLILLGMWAGLYWESTVVSTMVIAGSLTWMLVAYLFGVHGLARARGGSEGDWFRFFTNRQAARVRRQSAAGISQRPPFRTALGAQLWHECRRNAVFLPIMLGLIAVPMLPLVCLQVLTGRENPGLLFGPVHVSPAAIAIGQWLVIPLILCMTIGPAMGKFDPWGKEQMASFFAIRPLTTSQFILIKIVATAISALAAAAIVLGMFAVWAPLESSPLNARESVVRAALAGDSPRLFAAATASIVGLFALMWRDLVTGMWPTLTGRKWVSVVLGIATLVVMTGTAAAGVWIYAHPAIHPRLHAVVPWIVGALVLVKLSAAFVVFSAVRKNRLIESGTMGSLLAVWLALAVILFAVLVYVLPPTWLLAAAVVLAIPLTRIAAAPLALHWNRHR